jgi:hypothetical protein
VNLDSEDSMNDALIRERYNTLESVEDAFDKIRSNSEFGLFLMKAANVLGEEEGHLATGVPSVPTSLRHSVP